VSAAERRRVGNAVLTFWMGPLTAIRRSSDTADVTVEDLAKARDTVRPSLDPAQIESPCFTREFLSTGSEVREVVTGLERPRLISYQALSTIPPAHHDGGTINFREVKGGNEVEWSTTFRLKSPLLANFLTRRLYAPMIRPRSGSAHELAEDMFNSVEAALAHRPPR
jgi:hypothetical protein